MTLPVNVYEQWTTCLACGESTKGRAYCVPCFDDADTSDEYDPPDTSQLYYALEQLGDQIRDNVGERESWWTLLRELAIEVRGLGREKP